MTGKKTVSPHLLTPIKFLSPCVFLQDAGEIKHEKLPSYLPFGCEWIMKPTPLPHLIQHVPACNVHFSSCLPRGQLKAHQKLNLLQSNAKHWEAD